MATDVHVTALPGRVELKLINGSGPYLRQMGVVLTPVDCANLIAALEHTAVQAATIKTNGKA